MNDSDAAEQPFDAEEVLAQLRMLPWARQLNSAALDDLIASATAVQFDDGEPIPTAESGVSQLFLLVSGRVAVQVFDQLEKKVGDYIRGRGLAIGLLALGLEDHSFLVATAIEPVTAVRLRLPDLMDLNRRHAELQSTLLRMASQSIAQAHQIQRSLPRPEAVCVIHQTPATRPLSGRLIDRLTELGETVAAGGDLPEGPAGSAVNYRQLVVDGQLLSSSKLREFFSQKKKCDRLFLDFGGDHPLPVLMRLISHSDVVLWCLQPEDSSAAVLKLQAIEAQVPKCREKIRLVWIRDDNGDGPPHLPAANELATRRFQLTLRESGSGPSSVLERGLERIIHHLRGLQIGLALGGGAARGMAHLGVLKSLDRHGITVDMIAGTSAGAMTGILYAAGMSPGKAVQHFCHDLQPAWPFRWLPGGGYWYLLYKYRRHHFEPMLRKYLATQQMEQLPIPAQSISVDLVAGTRRVRTAGDAVANILESINLPPLALPIVRNDEALVDGGLLNNVPADVLVDRGCNIVIASTVTSQLEKEFMGVGSPSPRRRRRKASSLQVIMRQYLIQSYNMNYLGVRPADFMLAPDVSGFDLSEFTRADEMALIGERTTDDRITALRRMLSKVDSRLFPETAPDPESG